MVVLSSIFYKLRGVKIVTLVQVWLLIVFNKIILTPISTFSLGENCGLLT